MTLSAQRDDLARLAAIGRLRRLEPDQGIDFASNDYLGLAASGRLADAARTRRNAGSGALLAELGVAPRRICDFLIRASAFESRKDLKTRFRSGWHILKVAAVRSRTCRVCALWPRSLRSNR